MKKLLLEQVHPFIRYARCLEISEQTTYPIQISYDHRLFYCINGFGKIEIQGKIYEMTAGTVLLFKSGNPYHLLSIPKSNAVYIAFNFDFCYSHFDKIIPIPPQTIANFDSDEILESIQICDCSAFEQVLYLTKCNSFEQRLREIEMAYRKKIQFFNNKISGIFSEILSEIAKHSTLFDVDSATNNVIEKLLDYLHIAFNKQIHNKEIGEIFHFHPNYINTLMVLYTGTSLHQYIIKLRVDEAIRLLENSNFTIKEIAFRSGFTDEFQFSKTFKRITGAAPKEYRKNSKV